MLHRSHAGTQALRLRPRKPDVVLAPLTLEGQETSQATFSKAGSGPVAAQAKAVHVKKQRRVGGCSLHLDPWPLLPVPFGSLALPLLPPPSGAGSC